jgi:hypothetical protein
MTQHWEGRRKSLSEEFDVFAVTLTREMPPKRAGQIFGDGDSRMCRMLLQAEPAVYAVEFRQLWLGGSHESNRSEGRGYLTVFANLIATQVLLPYPERIRRFGRDLRQLNGQPNAIQDVANHISAAYTRGVRDNSQNNRVVSDKFLVIENVVEACDQIRNTERQADTETQERLL